MNLLPQLQPLMPMLPEGVLAIGAMILLLLYRLFFKRKQ